ncbi:isocitrate/isopropylmalate dehydrogenase family protein [Prauserella cavernicola]|uniref:Isocitrate/isopropylmalate dehydrogenase family protein n=1 Tax=Prauserella cavernicola TaxID=2800127 RepID=A0A934V6M5_9PSEU|nr:isocitrate/isopropylmalate family dehydrogenase [Prauserella cavernicola]MBK1787692.1 isocitrate/isopropylmalate dehydrogenase family protein [Prauserella cavernicola]
MTTTPTPYEIALIPGDGIGPELVDSAVQVLEAAAGPDIALRFTTEDAGADTYRRTGSALSDETFARLSGYAGILKGPVGLPEVRKPDGTEGGLLGGILRGGLDTYVNERPMTLLPGIDRPLRGTAPIDYVIVRENTEGLYLARGLGVGNDHACTDQLLMTRPGVERVVRYAFELARTRDGAPADGVRRVTCVDKSNVLRTFAFFRQIFDEIGEQYPDIERDYRYADAAGHDLVANPSHFDVLVMENFLGDILSDVGAATIGGLGMCPAGNIGDGTAYFEPIHGSAPTIAGRDLANPTSQILAAAMLADRIGAAGLAQRVRAAVRAAYEGGHIRILPTGSPEAGTAAATRAIIDALGD